MNDIVSRVDKFLENIRSQPPARGNLVFALDATASRERTWDTACQLQAQMFREVAALGTLSMKLAYFRGVEGSGGECMFSRWFDNPAELATVMTKIHCEAGYTQIARVLGGVSRETSECKINALVFVGDACEEDPDELIPPAKQLAQLGIPVFMFQEGHDRKARALFQEIAQITHGAYFHFDAGSAQQLSELLRAVAAFSVGGMTELEKQPSATARLMWQQMK